MKNACVGRCFRIFAITTVRGYICRWRRTRRTPDPFSPSVKSLRFLKSAACTISTNVTPPERGTLLMAEQTCALDHATRDFKTSGITSTNADPRYLISDSGWCRNLFISLLGRKSVAHEIFSKHNVQMVPDAVRRAVNLLDTSLFGKTQLAEIATVSEQNFLANS
jgi:hypothetical protein